jgi:dTDP-4-dehydrorhamnose reductase
MNRKILDGFIFNNEFDMINLRLHYLNDVVDHFIISESNYTHSGKLKPYYLDQIIDTIPEHIRKKIIRLKYEPDISNLNFSNNLKETDFDDGAWTLEHGQRNYITQNLSDFSPDDIIMVSDLDEIPNKKIIKNIRLNTGKFNPCVSKCKMFYYNFHTFLNDEWLGTVFSTVEFCSRNGYLNLRNSKLSENTFFDKIEDGGWHFSYFMDVENIKSKIKSFAHQEYNNKLYNTDENIINSIGKKKYIFDETYKFKQFNFEDLSEDIKEHVIEYFPRQYYTKVFIFGANGMLGNYLKQYFSNSFEVISITRDEINLLEDFSTITKKYNFNSYDVIINAAGIIKQRNYSSEELIKVNSLFPHFLSTLNCNVIHITTDCVFSGNGGDYDEDALHDCMDDYGKSKSLGENLNLTIIRTSIIGEEVHNKKSLLEWVKSNNNSSINGYLNHFWNGLTCLELSKHIERIIKDASYWKGIRHYFSPDTVSKYQLISYINEIYDLNNEVVPVKSVYCDRSLNTKYKCPVETSIKQQISDLKKFEIVPQPKKLKNFPTINAVSLKESSDRRNVLSSSCLKYEGLNIIFHEYERISEKECSEIEYNEKNIGDYVQNNLSFLGAITSHLKTIKKWYDTTDEEYGFFCEDDLSLETLEYWNFTWDEFMAMLPSQWQTVQLSLTRPPEIFLKHYKNGIHFKPRSWDDWSCVAYIIKRSHAKRLIDNYYSEGIFCLDYCGIDKDIRLNIYTNVGPETITYTTFEYNTNYTFPLFVTNSNFDSTVWDSENSHPKDYISEVTTWWKTVGKNKSINQLFNKV